MSRSHYVTGLRAVEQLLSNSSIDVRRIVAEYRSPNPRVEALVAHAHKLGIDVQSANRARLTQLCGEVRHQGIVAEVRRSTVLSEAELRELIEQRLVAETAPILLILDGVQDPHNLGACMRTALAAGALAIVVPRRGAAGLSPTVSKVAAGAAELLPFAAVANVGKVLDWLADYGIARVATSDRAATSLYTLDLTRPVAFVLGPEGSGLNDSIAARCDHQVRIPMAEGVSSLNVSVAAGVCLYEAVRQRAAG